jgi:Family of unknown function (DUF6194)
VWGAHGGAMQQPSGIVDQDAIIRSVKDTFTGVEVVRPTDGPGAGDTFFYDPRRDLDPRRRLPFATIVTKDYPDFDTTSDLDRPGVFRLNLAAGRDQFEALFGFAPAELDEHRTEFDFAALDRIIPHPVYGPQGWISVLVPGAGSRERTKQLITQVYERARRRHRPQRGR